MLKMLKKFFSFCDKKERRQFYLAIILTVLMGLCEAAKLPAIWYLFKNIFENDIISEVSKLDKSKLFKELQFLKRLTKL